MGAYLVLIFSLCKSNTPANVWHIKTQATTESRAATEFRNLLL